MTMALSQPATARRFEPALGDSESIRLRTATVADAPALYGLISANVQAGRLLPRTLPELIAHAHRFIVAVGRTSADCCGGEGTHDEDVVIGCAELAQLSPVLAEVRSLVVDERWRGFGAGQRLVQQVQRAAWVEGFATLCVFTHEPRYFIRFDFSIVPHAWLPEKIAMDCRGCTLFGRCGQYAMVCLLDASGIGGPGEWGRWAQVPDAVRVE